MIQCAALASALLVSPVAAQAQAIPAAIVVVVDTQKIFADCTACKAAQTQLQSQATAIQQRAQALGQPLQAEADAIQKAAAGKAPDAAFQTRIRALQTTAGSATQEIQGRPHTSARHRTQDAHRVRPEGVRKG